MLEVDGSLLPDVTDNAIALLIDRFYLKVRRDAVLGPVFEAAIVPQEWQEHLATMRRFWSSVMLTSGRYSGNPVAIHQALPNLEPPMFVRWLALFEQTANGLFVPSVADRFAAKARRIAASLQIAVFHRLRQPPEELRPPSDKPRASLGQETP